MSNENNIRYGFPKIKKNGELVGFKTYTTCVYDMNGNTIEDRLNALPVSEENVNNLKSHMTTAINAVQANSNIKNDNSVDISDALNSLLNTYTHVYLPAGDYKVTKKIIIPAGRILEGESVYNTHLNIIGGSSSYATGIELASKSNTVVNNLSIIGDNTAARTSAISITGSFNNVTLSNLILSNFNAATISISTNAGSTNSPGSNCMIDNVTIKQNLTNRISTTTYKTGTCVNIVINNKKDTVNITNLVCTSDEYVNGTFTTSYFYNFYNSSTNTFTTYDGKILVPIIKGVNIIGPTGVANDKSPSVHISDSIFEGMTEAIHCKQVSVSIVNCTFNLTIIGALLADSYSNCQVIGCTFLTLYDYSSKFGYECKRNLLANAYNLTVNVLTEVNGVKTVTAIDGNYTDPQPLARLEIYDISTEKKISKHAYILMLLSIIDVRVFTTEKLETTDGWTSKFVQRKLSVFGCGVKDVHGTLEDVTDS